MKKILVRGDDLGYSRAVNYGIYDTVHDGINNNVGVMVNMPSTEQGLELLKNEDVSLGMHTDISNGRPLSDLKDIPSLVDDNGCFKRSKIYRHASKDFVVLDQVVQEIEAQYQKFLDLVGEKPSYFEGHAVQSANFVKGLEIVAKRHNLAYLPFSGNEVIPFKHSKLMPFCESMLPNYQPMETFKKIIKIADKDSDVIPFMICHPGYLDEYILNTSSLTFPRPKEVELLCSQEVRDLIAEHDIELVKYSEID